MTWDEIVKRLERIERVTSNSAIVLDRMHVQDPSGGYDATAADRRADAEALRLLLAAAVPRADRERLAPLVALAEAAHYQAVGANALFSVEHWKHNAGSDWPHEPDDDSYIAFEHCLDPQCQAARRLLKLDTEDRDA